MDYGQAIKKIRKDMKQTQSVFGEAIGSDKSYISLIENNRKKPSLGFLEKIAEYSGKPIPVLLWNTLTIEDSKNKEAYPILKPSADSLIEMLF